MGLMQKSNTQVLINYYLFQKEIQKYLTNWKDKNDDYIIKIGYLVNPEWLKKWKELIHYDDKEGLLFLLNQFQIESRKLTGDQNDLVREFINKKIDHLNLNSINVYSTYIPFKSKGTFLSLKELENFINEDTYIKGMKAIKVQYVFKQKMLILYFDLIKVIKIIYFYEKEKKIVNIKYTFTSIKEYNEEKNGFLVKAKSQEIIEFLECNKIFEIKTYDNFDTKLKRKTYKIIYEEKENENDAINQQNNTISIFRNKKEETEKGKGGYRLKKIKTFSEKEFMTFVNDKKIFSVSFITPDQKTIPITCKHNMKFNLIENHLFKEYPEINNNNITYLVNGQIIERNSTFEENNIKAGDKIIIVQNENEKDNDNGNNDEKNNENNNENNNEKNNENNNENKKENNNSKD